MDGWKKEIQQQQCVREGSGFSLPQNQSADLTNEKLVCDRRGMASLSHRIRTNNECTVFSFLISYRNYNCLFKSLLFTRLWRVKIRGYMLIKKLKKN